MQARCKVGASNMASYREGRLRSIAWDHFEIKDKDKGVATCNLCHEGFSFRTSVSNLMKHLKNKHGYEVVKGENDDENEGGAETENEKGDTKPKEIKTELWEYYEVKDEENKLAICKICLDQFSYQTTTDPLYKHLHSKHAIDFGKSSDDEQETDNGLGNFETGVKGRRMSSVAWEYFEIKDDVRKVACCNICGAYCSYKTSVSNLMKHARRKHGVIGGPDDLDDERPEETVAQDSAQDDSLFKESKSESTSGRSQRSIVWLYFKPVDNDSKLSQCLICKKNFSHSSTLTNLKKHLARKHPNVKIPQREDGRKRILLSSGGELYEVETGNTFDADTDNDTTANSIMEMDTVYLEDIDLQDDEPLKKPKHSSPKKRKYSTSSEEEITFINRYTKKSSDSFDHFGKYMASLLRNLPKETSRKLQADFVKQIMSAEKDVDSKSNAFVPVIGSSEELSDLK